MSGSPTPVKTADDGGRSAIIYGFVISQTTYTIRDPLTQFITISVPSSTSSDTSSHSALGTTSNSTVSSLSISETTSKSIPSKTSSSKSSSTSHTGSPTSSHSSGHSSSKGVSGGAVAGIAVGVAVFASVVAFLLALFVLRSRRSRSYNERPYDSDNGRVTVLSKPTRDTRKGSRSANYELTKGPLAATGASKFDSDLPPSEDDYTIQNDIKGMLEQIVLHVDNYYNSTASKIPHEARVELESFSTSDSLPLIELLSDALSSHSVIQYCLTRQILNRISPHCDPASSFLPMSFVVLPSTLQKLETQKAMKSGISILPLTPSKKINSTDCSQGCLMKLFHVGVFSVPISTETVLPTPNILLTVSMLLVGLSSQSLGLSAHGQTPAKTVNSEHATSPRSFRMRQRKGYCCSHSLPLLSSIGDRLIVQKNASLSCRQHC